MRLNDFFAAVVFFLFLAAPIAAKAYPNFIGYGYSSCLTCHYNGHGGGALSDYGRALFATEIAARSPFASKTATEEEIGAASGFLGSKPMPWWIRPGLKYRGLWLKTDPGSQLSRERFINMQADMNLNLFADPDQNLGLITTISYAGLEGYYNRVNILFPREYYFRWKKSDNLWLYGGQMDKVFGLRNVDHTAINRTWLGIDQYSQTQGVVAHWIDSSWDFAGQVFFGNGMQETAEKQQGVSLLGEYQIQENKVIGGSFLTSQSTGLKWNLLAATLRLGMSKGSALLAEFGLRERTQRTGTAQSQLGGYAFVESLVPIARGTNFLSTLEYGKVELNKDSQENWRWSFGALLFPMPRFEIRAMAVHSMSFLRTGGAEDSWNLQGQVHASF